ncbi:hypothetical protein UPYG_G00089720 [Umbra pygmaea]|uniref:Mothers against decapentaplegic homolog n=1 Tax=Umbra pygmaea TaxID=75934 RepID=A0ABD0XIF3_UMBPY
MFRSKRSGLVRRLWRSRLIPDRDGGDGRSKRSEGGRDGSCGSNPEKILKTELGSVTRGSPSLGPVDEVCNTNLTDNTESAPGVNSDHGPWDAMCVPVPHHRGSLPENENDSRTVTCCLFRDRDPRPRSPVLTRGFRNLSHRDGSILMGRGETTGSLAEEELKNVTYALLKRIKEKPLDSLLEAVESKGGMPSDCVLVSQTDLRLAGRVASPPFLLCKLFRWTDLQHSTQLKALCHCLSFGELESCASVCCNPYHYSLLCGPESPPPPYSRLSPSDEHKPLYLSDSTLSTLSYTETGAPQSPDATPRPFTDTGSSLGSSTSCGQRSHWCSVAYWEQRTRVGRLYPTHEPSLSIFYDLPQGTGLCLSQLNARNSHCDDSGGGDCRGSRSSDAGPSGGGGAVGCVQRTRSKIGHGIVLSQEPDGVWVYNRSQHPVFIHSPTLDLPNPVRGLTVRRVMPGYSLKVFDYDKSSWILQQATEPPGSLEGPFDPHSVRISFAKGWGPCYSRQFITSCPCWLEVLLNTHR